MSNGLSTSTIAPWSEISRTTQSMMDRPKLQTSLPGSKVRP
jgi:hypothetical protein